MADHQPGVRPGHGQVVADGLGVRRADADVDQADAAPAGGRQVIGRHLVLAPGRVHHRLLGIGGVAGDHHPAGAAQRVVGAVRVHQLGGGPAHELVDVAMVVGEQDERLDVLHRRAGVVPQPRQREVGAQPVEVRQGKGLGLGEHHAVGDLVADVGQVGGREVAGDVRRLAGVERHGRPVHHIGEGDLLGGGVHADSRAIVLHQQLQLLDQIGAVQVRPGDRGLVDAGAGQAGIGPALGRRRGVALPFDAQQRIGEQAPGAGLGVGQGSGVDELADGLAQGVNGGVVAGDEAVRRRLGSEGL